MPASDRARASASRAASHIVRWRCPMWWSWATVSARSSRPVIRPGPPASTYAASMHRRQRAGVAPAELEQHHRQLAARVGRPAVVEVDHAQVTAGGAAQVVGPQVEVAGLHRRHRREDRLHRDEVGDHLGEPVGVRRPGGARRLEHALPLALADRRLEPLVHGKVGAMPCTAWIRASSSPSGGRVEPGVGVGDVDPGVDPHGSPATSTENRPPAATIGSGDGTPACQQARWNAPPCSASGSSAAASQGSNSCLTAQRAPVGLQPADLTQLAAGHRLAQASRRAPARSIGDLLSLQGTRSR